MRIAKKCTECGKKALVHIGMGSKHWCKACAHLAPSTPKPSLEPVDDGRIKIKFNLGEKIDESKEPETRGI